LIAGHVTAGVLDAASPCGQNAQQCLQQRRLARLVAADDTDPLALADVERHPLEHDLLLIPRREVVNGEQRTLGRSHRAQAPRYGVLCGGVHEQHALLLRHRAQGEHDAAPHGLHDGHLVKRAIRSST
jgi:hypothetical protein